MEYQSPTSSSVESSNNTLFMDFSFSTGGGAETSKFDRVIKEAHRLKARLFAETGGDFFNGSASSNIDKGAAVEERGLCYGVKRRKESRSGTSQNPQTPTPNLTPTKNNKSHVL